MEKKNIPSKEENKDSIEVNWIDISQDESGVEVCGHRLIDV